MKAYRSVGKAARTETVISRSRFIGSCFPVGDEGEALSILAQLRKEYWDATHNCYAYRIGPGAPVARFSDDGEPGGTAGMPMMDVLIKRDLTNVLVVVTRYFGGILLGAGGLVRAYSASVAAAVDAAGILGYLPATRMRLQVEYARYASMRAYVCEHAVLEDTLFGADVTMMLLTEDAQGFAAGVAELSDGRCRPEPLGEAYIKAAP